MSLWACPHKGPIRAFATALQVLFDLGVVSTAEPFQRLVSQGMILGEVEFTAHRDPGSGAWAAEDAPGAETVRCGGVVLSAADPHAFWSARLGTRFALPHVKHDTGLAPL